MTLLALAIRERADGEQVGSVEQRDAIVEREALPDAKLLVDLGQPGRVDACVHVYPSACSKILRAILAGHNRLGLGSRGTG